MRALDSPIYAEYNTEYQSITICEIIEREFTRHNDPTSYYREVLLYILKIKAKIMPQNA